MSPPRLDCELVLFRLGLPLPIVVSSEPAVCLLAADTLPTTSDLSAMALELVRVGCRYFMTWGGVSDELHDALDEILEAADDEHLSIVTASHKGESVDDVAWFLVHAAMPGEIKIRCFVGYDEETNRLDSLLRAVRAETSD